MVLEHLFPEDWLERKSKYAFLLGAVYSLMGITLAKILFPGDPALVAVVFTSLLLLPELYKLFSIEEKKEEMERRFSFVELFRDNKGFVKVYLFLVLGIFMVYTLAAVVLPSMQVNYLFRKQLELRGITGGMAFQVGLLWEILVNNWWVLVACFVVSLLTGDGAVFLITWNASLWGTIFGITAKNAATFAKASPFWYLFLVLIIVMPHAFLEIMAYVLGAISGGVISKDVLLERFDSGRFWEVFKYNFMLFIVAVVILVIGAIVETYVLGNSQTYQNIIMQSYLFLG